MRRLKEAAFSLVLLLLLAACAGQAQKPPSTGHPISGITAVSTPTLSTILPPARYQAQVRSNIAYGPLPEETLDLCLPVGASGLRPSVILVHGGGWVNGDKSEFASECSYLASQGFVAATVNYRLAPTHFWPAQLEDVQLAVRFLRAHATEMMLDPSRLCSWGDSSGAHLAVFLGVLDHAYPGDESAQLANQSSMTTCVIDDFGPIDLTTYGVTNDQKSLLLLLFGNVSLQSNPQLYHEASPNFYVTTQTSPMLIVQGTQDVTVPQSQSQTLLQALQQHEVSAQYISYIGGHGFSGLTGDQWQVLYAERVSFLVGYEHP